MTRRLSYINLMTARWELRRVIDTVQDLGNRFVLHRHNVPVAVVISAEEYRKFEEWERTKHRGPVFERLIEGKLPIPRGSGLWSQEQRHEVTRRLRPHRKHKTGEPGASEPATSDIA